MTTKNDIQLFIEKADLLMSSRIFQSPIEIHTKVSFKQGEGMKTEQTMPNREDIESFGMRIRIFLAPSEPLFLDTILDYLINNDAQRADAYSQYLTEFDSIKSTSPLTIELQNGGTPQRFTSYELIWQYLYGEYFHLDDDKRTVLKSADGLIGKYAENAALGKLIEVAGLILEISNYLKQNDVLTSLPN